MHLSIFLAIFGFALHVVSLPVPPDFHYLIYHSEVKDEINGLTYAQNVSRLQWLAKKIPEHIRNADYHKTKSERLYRDAEEHGHDTEMGKKLLRRANRHRGCALGHRERAYHAEQDRLLHRAAMHRIIESNAS